MNDEPHLPISQRSIEDLLAKAQTLRSMAATASTRAAADALLRLAQRFDALTQRQATLQDLSSHQVTALVGSPISEHEFSPGELAPAGLFEELDTAGGRTGVVTFVEEGARLPGAPRGFRWRPCSAWPTAELLARATEYRRLAVTSATIEAANRLLAIAERLEARARNSEQAQDQSTTSPSRWVQSRVLATSGDPPRYYYEVWTDLGDDRRLAIQTSPEFRTKAMAMLACEEAVQRYRSASNR
jgi:hypothetical protein